MNERDFCYWLRGFLEVANPGAMTAGQIAMVKEHLDLVFSHVTGKVTDANKKASRNEELEKKIQDIQRDIQRVGERGRLVC